MFLLASVVLVLCSVVASVILGVAITAIPLVVRDRRAGRSWMFIRSWALPGRC
jgi:hypothetical protein